MDEGNHPRRKLYDPTRETLNEIKSGARAGVDAVHGNNNTAGSSAGGTSGGALVAASPSALRSAEDSATDSSMVNSETGALSTVDGVRSLEESADAPGGFYTGSGRSENTKGKAKGRGRKKGPIAALAALLLGVGVFMAGGQTLMPFSIVAQFQETFDTIKVSNEARTRTMWAKQMSNQDLVDPIHKRYFGFGEATFKVQNRQKQKLRSQGIYVEEDFGGTGRTAMLFDDGSGQLKIVGASDADVDAFSRLDASQIDLSKIDFGSDIDVDSLTVDTSNVRNFTSAMNDVADFRNGYIAGSRTWRGSVGAWFDKVTVAFLQSNKLTRNHFQDFQERVRAESEGNTKAEAQRKAAIDAMEPDDDTLTSKGYDYELKEEEVEDENGNTTTRPVDYDTDVDSSVSIETKGAKKAAIKQKLNAIKESKIGGASGTAQAAVNIVCSVFDVIGAINLLIVAQETIQILSLTTSYFEAFDKVKAGDGDDSPIHVLAEGLVTTKATTKVVDSDSEEVEEEVVPGKENTTAMQSAGMVALYGNTKIDPHDASVSNFNVGASFSTILGSLGTSFMSFAACAAAKMAAAAVGATLDAVSIVGCILSFGLGCVAEALIDSGTGALLSIGIAGAATVAVSVLTPLALKWFTKDLISDLAGEDLGNALVSGANTYLGSNHKSGGGSLASEEKYVQFALQQQESIAETARFERETLSPFDITSQYTFAGSLLKELTTLSTIQSPVFGALGTITRMASNSVMAFLPSASAYNVAQNLPDPDTFEETCPWLSSIGAVGDAYCNPLMITDVSTIETDPIDVVNQTKNLGGIDDEGDIVDDSDLSYYIRFCSQRASAFGVADGNIAANFASADSKTGNNAVDTTVNAALGAVPLVGDLLDLVNDGNQLANSDWITGEACVAKSSEKWSENKTYQRFVEDQRYLESVDPDYKSPVTAYLEKYYEENPLDNSYEGILARYSGLTKDTVVALLDVIEEENYIANYDPSDAYAFGQHDAPLVDEPLRIETPDAMPGETLAVLLGQTVFADLRSRNFAV